MGLHGEATVLKNEAGERLTAAMLEGEEKREEELYSEGGKDYPGGSSISPLFDKLALLRVRHSRALHSTFDEGVMAGQA